MERASLFWLSVCSALVLPACSGAGQIGDDSDGMVELSLSEAPEDARCLEISFDGARDLKRKLSLTPGTPASFLLERLPVGLSNVDAQAYSLACASVASTTAPSYVLESPVTVRIKPLEPTRIVLSLIQSGRLGVDVEFEQGLAGDLEPIELALIGDTPYGAAQLEAFPALISDINAAGVHAVIHVGDIKNGSTRCDDGYFARIFGYFATFNAPLVYTPGDNEWTDCHRANNGAYDPLERLDVLRELFYPVPGVTLGEPKPVLSQASVPAHARFVENQLWYESGIAFSTVHVVGSSNGYATWFGTDTTGTRFDDPERRIAEVEARIAASLDWIDRTFDLAQIESAKGVVLFMQADTFMGSTSGFLELIQLLAERARAFARPVLLVQGDSHRYLVDLPFATANAEYEVEEPVPNLTRIVVEGETVGEWLKLSIDANSAAPFSWEPMLIPD
jgi:hypothetical protein